MTEELKTLASYRSSQHEPIAPSVESCLRNDDILAFAQGRLEGNRFEQVHAHVDVCEVCQCLVAEAAHALDSEPISESTRPSWNSVFQPNAMIAKRYRIVNLVARGGMGEVYEAYDTALQDRVALKTVTSTDCDNPEAVKRLKAEVQLARRISHPNVCRIYDFGTHVMVSSGIELHFLVMEYVEGECLGKKLRQFGALPLDRALSIAQQLLHGLRAAHEAGVLHRDFKSDNVMLRSESNGRVTPVILDFGLAKVLNNSGSLATTQNQDQAMVGTLGYMAPEQIEGAPLSTASDLYSFGVVWFEMVTGQLPFTGDSPIASAMARLQRPPMAPRSLNPQIPNWIDDLILRCLRRRRAERFVSAEQVLNAIDNRLSSPPNRFSKRYALTRPWTWVVLIGIAGSAVMGLAMARKLTEPKAIVVPDKPKEVLPSKAQLLPSAPVVNADVKVEEKIDIETDETVKSQGPSTGKPKMGKVSPHPPKTPSLSAPPRALGSITKPALPATDTEVSTVTRPSLETTELNGEPDWLPIWSDKEGSEAPAIVQ